MSIQILHCNKIRIITRSFRKKLENFGLFIFICTSDKCQKLPIHDELKIKIIFIKKTNTPQYGLSVDLSDSDNSTLSTVHSHIVAINFDNQWKFVHSIKFNFQFVVI